MLLILTSKSDGHTDEVIRRLTAERIDVFRLNTEDILSKYKTTLRVEADGSWKGCIVDELNRTLAIDEVKVAWFRKPDFDFFGEDAIDAKWRTFIAAEAKALIDVLYSLPNIRWINDPFVANRSKSKVQQLLCAGRFGIKVPRTIVTTDPSAAELFFKSCNEEVLTKSIYTSNITVNGIEQGIPSRKIHSDDFDAFRDNISICPTQLQEYIAKEFELRITVIGKKVFAVKIDSQKNIETMVDWRLHTALNPHSIFDLPDRIRDFCIEFLAQQNLSYGAMDFIVSPNGDYVFLENNPFGQYLWLEIETGLPLTDEICHFLITATNA